MVAFFVNVAFSLGPILDAQCPAHGTESNPFSTIAVAANVANAIAAELLNELGNDFLRIEWRLDLEAIAV
jgi:hypothetical protein